MTKQLVFDLETQRSFQEVGGRDNFQRLGVSLAVTYDLIAKEYKTYFEKDVAILIEDLLSADKVIGFNIKRFDFVVLQGYSDTDFKQIKAIDLLEIIHKQLGFRVSLDKLANATFNQAKSGHGLLALKWFRTGRWRELEEYCRKDVELTARLYLYGQKKGFVYYPSREGKKQVSTAW